ncbi:hypothetical protein TRAPUB_5544 [Trametes pubescens]|uniref:Uncharacterized protein n=1 Tax=Trametes pubescens TaxID=154538 RepID=A0A1M2V8B9_TRAPU|nr:hypothetical protein TRAPUB_5544 [Trametes pubescens]
MTTTTSSRRQPNPIYVEGISVLERLLNYLYTGAAKVLPCRLMRHLWILRGILDTGYPVISPVLSIGGKRKLTPMLDISKWPLDPVTHRPLTSSKRAQEISYGRPHYLGFETLFHMYAAIAHMKSDRWRDATAVGRELRVLADIAVGAFLDDVRDLVRTQIRAEILPILDNKDADGYSSAKTRRLSLRKWLEIEHPLDWGEDAGTHIILVQAVARDAIQAARGLPSSNRGQLSVDHLVDHFLHVGKSTGLAALRPPIWNKGQCWPVLRAAVTQAQARAQVTMAPAAADKAIKDAFITIVEERRIHFYPDSLPPSGDNLRRSLQPSFQSWTLIGPQARLAVVPGRAAPMTQEENLQFEMSKNSLEQMHNDRSSVWNSTLVLIGDYHEHLDRTVLPQSWKITSDMLKTDSDQFTVDCYEWAKYQFVHKRSDWKCDLALILAFLISKVRPAVAWKNPGKTLDTQLSKLGISGPRSTVPPASRGPAINVIRTLNWTEREGVNGVHQEDMYFTQASIVFLCWICEDSPLRKCLKKPNGSGLGAAWGNKHQPKSLTPLNLIRMGLAYPIGKAVTARPVFNTNFKILDDIELKNWHKEVISMLKQRGPKGPFALVLKIFGGEVATRLAASGHFPDQPSASQRSVSSSSSSTAVSASSRTSSKRNLSDLVEDDNSWLVDNDEAGEFAIPSRRIRTA